MPIMRSIEDIIKDMEAIEKGQFSTKPKVTEYEGKVNVIAANKHISKNTGKQSIEIELQTPNTATFKTWLSLSDKVINRTIAQLGLMLQKAGADIKTIETANKDSIEDEKDRAVVYAQNLSRKIDKGAKIEIWATRKKVPDSDFYNVNLSFVEPAKNISEEDFFAEA